jgi:hypothetical protein
LDPAIGAWPCWRCAVPAQNRSRIRTETRPNCSTITPNARQIVTALELLARCPDTTLATLRKEIAMATAAARPPVSAEIIHPKTLPLPNGSPPVPPPTAAFQPGWEHLGNAADRVTFVFWLACFVMLAAMVLGEMVAGVFR